MPAKKIKTQSVNYKLKFPLAWGEDTIEDVTLTRPKGKHVKQMKEGGTLGDVMQIASKISGQPTTVFDEMDAEDYFAVAELIGDFLDRGHKTGKSN
jgi:hypothetical protein